MTNTRNDLRQGTLWKQILFFSLPIAATSMLQQLFNSADVAVVGRFSAQKDLALAAVGSTSSVVNLFITIITGLAVGANVVIARSIGASDEKRARQAVHTALILSLLCGAILLVLGECIALPLLEIMDTPSDIIGLAGKYLRIYMLGVFFQTIYNFEASILRANGDTRRPLFCLIFSGAVNVVLNLVFVIGFQLDVAGVALASILSQYVSAILILIHMARLRNSCRLEFKALTLSIGETRRILGLGIPSGIQNGIFAIANLFIQIGVNSFDSTIVSGNSAAVNVDNVIYNVMAAFYTGCSTFMGQNWGAGKKDRMLKSYYISLGYSFLIAAVLSAAFWLCAEPFLYIFTNDADVVATGIDRMRIMCFSYAISAFMDCTIAACRGLGRSLIPTIIVVLGSCVFRVIWVYTIFAHFHTIPSLYLLYPFSWILTAAAEIGYFIHCFRRLRPMQPQAAK